MKTKFVKVSRKHKIFREIVAVLVWFYVILKLFIFDLDRFLVDKYFTDIKWIVDFKFFILLPVILILWLIFGNQLFIRFLIYVLTYPFILFFWKILKLSFKNSILGIFFVGVLINFFKSIKKNFIVFTIVSLSTVIILVSFNDIASIIAMFILIIFLIYHFVKRFYLSFSPSQYSSKFNAALNKFWDKKAIENRLNEVSEPEDIELLTKEEKDKRNNEIQILLILNRLCLFLSSNLKRLQQRSVLALYVLISVIYTFLLTIVIFALENFALFNLNPANFSAVGSRSFLFFLYYSFNSIMTNNIADFMPVSDITRFANSIEIFFGVLVLIVLFYVYTTINREKYSAETDTMILLLNQQGEKFESHLTYQFNMSSEDAIKEIEKMNFSLIKLIYFLTSGIRQ